MSGSASHDEAAAGAAAGRPRDPRIEDAMLEAARALLVEQGFGGLSLSGVAARAGSNRPALYRRWHSKLALVVDALKFGYRRERALVAEQAVRADSPRARFAQALAALDPRVVNPHAYVLQGDVLAESERNPLLLAALQEHAVEPRCADFAAELRVLQEEGSIRADVDVQLLATLCFGGFFGAILRHGSDGADDFAPRITPVLWAMLAVEGADRVIPASDCSG